MENNPEFLERLRISDIAKYTIAGELISKGHDVTTWKTNVPEDRSLWRNYTDKGDLHVDGKRVEVKRRKLVFTSANDFPFPDLIVCSCQSHERAKSEGDAPVAYIYLDNTETHVGVVNIGTEPQWYRKSTGDSVYGYTTPCFYVAKDQILFGKLEQLDELLFLGRVEIP